jgi:hypothetical protein
VAPRQCRRSSAARDWGNRPVGRPNMHSAILIYSKFPNWFEFALIKRWSSFA